MPRRGLPADPIAATVEPIRQAHRRLDKLEQPDAGQLFRALDKITTIISNIGTYVDAYLSGGTTTLNLINSLATYSRNVTGSGSYRVMYVNIAGEIGYVPSSLRFKTDVETADFDIDALKAIRLVTFRYIAAVETMGDQAPTEWGVIAEELDALGLSWLVDYDEHGKPFSLRHDRMWVAVMAVLQDQERRLQAAGI